MSLSYEELSKIRKDYEEIYTQISPFANMQLSFSVNIGNSKSESHSEGNTKLLKWDS